jgi:putative ABC transport system permease protein
MLRNYIKIAWRNITARKFYTFINVSGLALAIACCTLIYLYIGYNLSFDTYHKQPANIFKLVNELHLDKTEYDKSSSYAMVKTGKAEIPQIKQATFLVDKQSFVVTVAGETDKRFKEEKTISFTDASWFNLFSYQWLKGSAAVLNQPGNVVLTEKAAHKYFGDADPMGRVLLFDKHPLKVNGLIADGPYNTDLKYDIYVSFSLLQVISPSIDKYFYTQFGDLSSVHNGFIALNNERDKDLVEQQLNALAAKHLGKDAMKYYTFRLLPLKDLHFDTRYGATVQRPLLLTLAVIGLLIMAIAAVNYINMVIAQQTKRGVEIGTRKVLGGSSRQIFTQFITESAVTSAIAVVIAMLLVRLALPLANTYLFADEPIHVLSFINLGIYLALMLLLITFGTGVYPALVLSRISVMRALKNNVLNLPAGIGRKVLVIFQNTITQALIVCTIIIVMQVQFLKNTDMGFSRKMVVTVPVGQLTATQKQQFSNALAAMPDVKAFSFCLKPPSSDSKRGATVKFDNRTDWEKFPARFAIGDAAYCNTFGLTVIAGRNIRNEQATPELLINQTMARMLENKNPENVIGKKLQAGDANGVIVGIVKDFNVKSLIEPIEPSVLLESKNLQTNLDVKLNGRHTAETLTAIQNQFKNIVPDQVFSYQFVDEQIAALYKKESIQQKLIWLSSLLAIFISSLGLLGLISLTALQRTKEIGIRKVLGATVTQISMLLSADFIGLVLLAFAIAAPIAWWAMHNWLQGFAYRITIQWWMFALAIGSALVIAICSVSIRAIQAATANPVRSLRSE